jgi:hypothetical protein
MESLPHEENSEQTFPLPWWAKVRVRGLYQTLAPSPHCSAVKAEQVRKSTNARLLLVSLSPLGWRLPLVLVISFSLVFAGFARTASAAEGTRFLVSYGGTAGYQLPLWVNKELGFSKKYGIDLEIVLIQAGSPNLDAGDFFLSDNRSYHVGFALPDDH